MNTEANIPPIVLLAGLQDAAEGPYSDELTKAGFWVANSGSLEEALRDIDDLRPDIVVADLTTRTVERQRREFVHRLKASSVMATVPAIVLEEAVDTQRSLGELGPLDVRVLKPVSPPALRSQVDRALAASRGARQRGPLSDPVDKSNRVDPTTQSVVQTCPECGKRLVWVDRKVVGGTEYDYFRWCASGCGLHCLNVATHQWLKLA